MASKKDKQKMQEETTNSNQKTNSNNNLNNSLNSRTPSSNWNLNNNFPRNNQANNNQNINSNNTNTQNSNQNNKQNNNQTSNNNSTSTNNQNNNKNSNNQGANNQVNNNQNESTHLIGAAKPVIKKNNYHLINNTDFTKMPVVNAVNTLIITAIDSGASDLHFDPTDDGILVRFRIDGELRNYAFLPLDIKQNVTTRIKIMAGMNITETRLPQDGAIKDNLNGKDLDLRVSSLPTKKGEKIVIRVMDYSMSLKGIEYLYFNETNYNKVLKMLSFPNGIILVTGATGTGKSTTLYSFLQKLNVEGTNLITVEDPVEMDIKGVNQVQVNSDIGLDFATVLRSILRQDPNVIMIGEIRDSETAKIAVRASITGHLVLSTIHTNNSLNTIERLLDMDVERYLLASALTGIVSQKLAVKLCDHCKQKRAVTVTEKNLFKAVLGLDINEIFDANPNGCNYCNHGYKGRIAIQEVLLINQEVRDAISAGIRKDELRSLVYSRDVITMLQDGLFKVVAGFTTTNEILKLIEVEDETHGIL